MLLQVLDTLHGIGPMRDLAMAPLNLLGDPEASLCPSQNMCWT